MEEGRREREEKKKKKKKESPPFYMTAFQIKSIRLKGVHTYTSDVMFILREAWLTLKMKTDRLKGGSGGGGGGWRGGQIN